MKGRPGDKKPRTFIPLLGLALALAVSCASPPSRGHSPDAGREAAIPSAIPAAKTAPLPAADPHQSSPSLTASSDGGTAIKTADPAALARGREEREAIETAIVFGSPSSLLRARDLAAGSKTLSSEEAAALSQVAAIVMDLVYPETRPLALSQLPLAGLSTESTALLLELKDAASGKVVETQPETAGLPLGELAPSLALFAMDSDEASRLAFDALDRFARLGVPSILPSLVRGIDAERRGDWQGALSLYRSALSIAPDAWTASLGSARALLGLRRSDEAMQLFDQLAKDHAGVAAFDRGYALALYSMGRYDQADPYVMRALIANPQDLHLVIIRARLLIRSKAFQQAQVLLDAYGTLASSDRLYLLLRAQESEGLQARDEALGWARKGLALYPDDPELLAAAARLLFAGPAYGRPEGRSLAAKVLSLVKVGEALPPDSGAETGLAIEAARTAAASEAAALLARDAADRYQWQDAAAYLARCSSTFPDKAQAALILRKSSSPSAFDFANTWYKSDPKSEEATSAYLRALVVSADARTALDTLGKLLPNIDSHPLRSLIFSLEAGLQKDDGKAVELLRQALVENADNAEALAALSDLNLRAKDYTKARFYLRQALAIDPDDPELASRQQVLDKAMAQ